jgi:hypothetical protein
MKLSQIMITALVTASLSGMAQDKSKQKDSPVNKTEKPVVKGTKNKTERPEDKRKAKQDSINKANTIGKGWNCPPCGMG